MNLGKLFCLTALACISSNVFAMEIYKGKVVSEKLYASDGSKATLAVKKHAVKRAYEEDFIYNTASIPSSNAWVNKPVVIDGASTVSIFNNEGMTKSYEVRSEVCSETSEATTHCVYYYKTVLLESGGYYYDDAIPLLKMSYSKPGRYKTWVKSGLWQSYEHGTFPVYTRANSAVIVS